MMKQISLKLLILVVVFLGFQVSLKAQDLPVFGMKLGGQSKVKVLPQFPISNNFFMKSASLKAAIPVWNGENFSPIYAQRNYYGAIAFSQSTGATGGAWDHYSEYDASRAAVNSCGRPDCRAVFVFWNTCGALAVGDGRGWGTGSSPNRYDAQIYAKSSCRKAGNTNCQDYYWICTTRY